MTDVETLNEVGCTFCGSAKGSPCTDTRTGSPTRRPHPSRRNDAGFSMVGEHPEEMPEIRWDRSQN